MGLFSDYSGININPGGNSSVSTGGAAGFLVGGFPGAFVGNSIQNGLPGSQSPSLNIPAPSADLTEKINREERYSRATAGGYSNQYMEGAKNAGGLLNTDQGFNQGLGGNTASMSSGTQDALARRSSNLFSQNLGDLQKKADFAGIQRQIQSTNQAASNKINLDNLKNNVDTRVQEAQFAADQARAQVIGQFLGAGGQVAGIAMARGFGGNGGSPSGPPAGGYASLDTMNIS